MRSVRARCMWCGWRWRGLVESCGQQLCTLGARWRTFDLELSKGRKSSSSEDGAVEGSSARCRCSRRSKLRRRSTLGVSGGWCGSVYGLRAGMCGVLRSEHTSCDLSGRGQLLQPLSMRATARSAAEVGGQLKQQRAAQTRAESAKGSGAPGLRSWRRWCQPFLERSPGAPESFVMLNPPATHLRTRY